MKNIIKKHFTAFILMLVVILLVASNIKTNVNSIVNCILDSKNDLTKAISDIQSASKEQFVLRNHFVDIYGLTNRAFGKKIINDEYIRDSHNIIQRKSGSPDFSNFVSGIRQLSDFSKSNNIPLIYVSLPDKATFLGLSDSPEFVFEGQQSKIAEGYICDVADCIDMGELLTESDDAPPFDSFYFKTDLHCTTYGEFWMAKKIAQHLNEKYQITFTDMEAVWDINNYDIKSYNFLGNTARSVGKYYVGLDSFEIYKPKFATNFTLINQKSGVNKTGDFNSVILNGYESSSEIDEYTYWITDYGQFTSPKYTYINNIATDDAPSVLVICDSLFMRGFSYLALTCKSVTVLDPRFFEGENYILTGLLERDYDAIIVVGSDSNFFSCKFESFIELPALPTKDMITEEEYGDTIGNSGICIDMCNEVTQSGPTLFVASNATDVWLWGWAADFYSNAPFKDLYLQVGDILLRCTYKFERTSVVEKYGIGSLLNTGFSVTFPASWIKGDNTDIYFVGVSNDGEFLYTPVKYQVVLTEAESDNENMPLNSLDAEIVSHTAPLNVKRYQPYSFEITVKNTGTETWTEDDMIRLCIWQDGYDGGYRVLLSQGVTVAPGESYTFVQNGFEVLDVESTVLEFQMLKETVCYFGEKEPVTITAE